MLELFWIKSLFYFLLLGLGTMFLVLLYKRKNYLESKVLFIPLAIITLSQLLGFLFFTPWIRDLLPSPVLLYKSDAALQFLLGPILLYAMGRYINNKSKLLLHIIPAAAVSVLLLFDVRSIYDSSAFFLIPRLHLIIYFGLAVGGLGKLNFKSIAIFRAFKMLFLTVIISTAIHITEYAFWQLFNLISEAIAWIFYIVAELLLIVGITQLMYTFLTHKLTSLKNGGLSEEIIKQLRTNLDKCLSDPRVFKDPLISLGKVAKKLQVDSHHLSKYLNDHIGESFVQGINRRRIELCIKHLEDVDKGKLTIESIYFDVGFSSKSVFYRVFRDHTGYTPSQYREKFGASKVKHG